MAKFLKDTEEEAEDGEEPGTAAAAHGEGGSAAKTEEGEEEEDGAGSRFKLLLLTGGTDVKHDIAAIKTRGCQIIVATPGRLLDVMKRSKHLNLATLDLLILDEADRLLDMGFRQTLDDILPRLPRQRRTGLFSATQTQARQPCIRPRHEPWVP